MSLVTVTFYNQVLKLLLSSFFLSNNSYHVGLEGLLSQHPRTYMAAWRNRDELELQKKLNEVFAERQEDNAHN